MKLKVIVPAYNCFEYLDKCLDSLALQTRQPDDVVIVDDASTDARQAPFIADRARRHGWKAYLANVNRCCPYNLWLGMQLLDPDPDDVIIILDGDDWLAHDGALARIEQEYDDPDCWVAYGSYEAVPPNPGAHPATPYPPEVIRNAGYRIWEIWFNHPLTFRAFLWDHIKPADLQDDDGNWFTRGYDQLIMYPLLELAGEHQRFIPDTLYCYNTGNPLHDAAKPDDNTGGKVRARMARPRLSEDTHSYVVGVLDHDWRHPYGDIATYESARWMLKTCEIVEDWGCGRGFLRNYIPEEMYRGVDIGVDSVPQPSPFADVTVDLVDYTTTVDGIFMRHVLDHNDEWARILANALASFTKRMVLVLFTPWSTTDYHEVIALHGPPDFPFYDPPKPNIAFHKNKFVAHLAPLQFTLEEVPTSSQYGLEHVFRIWRPGYGLELDIEPEPVEDIEEPT